MSSLPHEILSLIISCGAPSDRGASTTTPPSHWREVSRFFRDEVDRIIILGREALSRALQKNPHAVRYVLAHSPAFLLRPSDLAVEREDILEVIIPYYPQRDLSFAAVHHPRPAIFFAYLFGNPLSLREVFSRCILRLSFEEIRIITTRMPFLEDMALIWALQEGKVEMAKYYLTRAPPEHPLEHPIFLTAFKDDLDLFEILELKGPTSWDVDGLCYLGYLNVLSLLHSRGYPLSAENFSLLLRGGHSSQPFLEWGVPLPEDPLMDIIIGDAPWIIHAPLELPCSSRHLEAALFWERWPIALHLSTSVRLEDVNTFRVDTMPARVCESLLPEIIERLPSFCISRNLECIRLFLRRGIHVERILHTLSKLGYHGDLMDVYPESRGVNLEWRPPRGKSILHYAVRKNKDQCVKFLLERGASPASVEMMVVVQAKNIWILRKWLSLGLLPDPPALEWVCRWGGLSRIQLLAASGAPPSLLPRENLSSIVWVRRGTKSGEYLRSFLERMP